MTAWRVGLALLALVLVLSQAGDAEAQQPSSDEITLDLAGARSVWVLDEARVFSHYVPEAPDFVNREFVGRWVVWANQRSITIELEDARAVWIRDEGGVFSSYVIGAPDFINDAFVERWLIAEPVPATPAGVAVTKIDIVLWFDDLLVTWNAVDGADWYEVFHSTRGEHDFEGLVLDLGYLDEYPNVLLPDSYIVRACNSSGCSAFTAPVTEDASGSLLAILQGLLPAGGFSTRDACTLLGVGDLIAGFVPQFGQAATVVTSVVGRILGCDSR